MTATQEMDRKVPWHAARIASMHKDIEGGTRDSMVQAMVTRGLDWEVGLAPVYYEDGSPLGMPGQALRITRPVPDKQAIVRLDTGRPLDVVGMRYTPYQNRSLAEFTDIIVNTGDGEAAAMGFLKGGKLVYCVVKLGPDIAPLSLPDEAIGLFLITVNGHGGSAVTATIAAIRYVCSNGQIGLVDGFAHSISVRHTANMGQRMAQAQRIIARSHTYLDRYQATMEQLLAVKVIPFNDDALIERMVPHLPNATKRQDERIKSQRKELRSMWMNSPNLETIRWTGYGFVQAVAEWDQHGIERNKRRTRPEMERMIVNGDRTVVARARELVLG